MRILSVGAMFGLLPAGIWLVRIWRRSPLQEQLDRVAQ
jgi:hypothetical protein